jgi:SpoVK/Ycf46/Vps4 family AAA+-type ATPase
MNLNYPLYDVPYGAELPSEQYFIALFNRIPSKYRNSINFYDANIINYFLENNFVVETKIYQNGKRKDNELLILLVNHEKNIFANIQTTSIKNDRLYQLDFLYDIKNGEIESQIDFTKLVPLEKKKSKSSINLVKLEMGHLDLEEYDLLVPPTDLELNYGKEFLKIHDVIVEKLNKQFGKGIILLHGDPGTGKSSYLKILTTLIQDKDILFIPPSMAEMLSEPSIIPFLMDHKNSILIIEDAERVIADREGNGSPAGVSNILNLTDGILGDCLNIQIIATFNMKREKIDRALLRKGRLIAEHKFSNLSVDESNKLLKSLGKDYVVDKQSSLADLYNIDVDVYRVKNNEKIGF